MSDVTVREASSEDVGGVVRVAERGWDAAYGGILSSDAIDAAMAEWYDAGAVREVIERDDVAYFVAEREGTLVGYVSGGPSDEGEVAVPGAIYVSPDHWGNGIGTALLDRFEEFCRRRDREAIRFRVPAGNDVGVSFYRTRSYEVVDEGETDLFGDTVREFAFRGTVG